MPYGSVSSDFSTLGQRERQREKAGRWGVQFVSVREREKVGTVVGVGQTEGEKVEVAVDGGDGGQRDGAEGIGMH